MRDSDTTPMPAPAQPRSDYRTRLRAAAVALLVVIALGPLPLRLAGFNIPRAIGFRLIIVWLILCTIIWWTYADRAITRKPRKPNTRAALRIALAAFVLLITAPAVNMLYSGRIVDLLNAPLWAAGAFQLWHMGMALALPLILLAALFARIGIRAYRAIRTAQPAVATPESKSPDLSRREWLATTGVYAPLLLVGGLSVASTRQLGRFNINRYDLPAPWLPPRLRGLTITHVSDLHVGRLYRPLFLPHLVDQVNALKSDLIVLTGDLVDVSNDMLPPSLAALHQFRAPRGLHLVIGNHDMIDNRNVFIQTVRDAGFNLLVNQRRTLDIDGDPLTLAGLDWSRTPAGEFGRPGHMENVRRTLAGHDPQLDGPAIALAHHPHAFDALATAGIPLTLSGHTHGGQFMLRPPRADGIADPDHDLGAGELLFKYMRGLYSAGPSNLFVNSGVGNWFPIRINAPAEIVQLRLV